MQRPALLAAIAAAAAALAAPLALSGIARADPSPPPAQAATLAPALDASVRVLDEARRPDLRHQLRIEQRLVVRIAPGSEAAIARMLETLPRRPLRQAFAEEPHDDCVPVASLAGVQPLAGNRLLLYTRERDILAVSLERSCSADAFYSGFYVERSADGRLCAARDSLHSRAGATCAVAGFRRLVAVRE